MAGPYHYRAYGLSITSDLALPELEPDEAASAPDLTIRLGPTGRAKPETYTYNAYEFGTDEQFLCWPLVGGFLIKGVSSITIERTPGVADNLLPFPLLGPVMAVVLHLRGMLVLHSSAVAVGGKTAIFLGNKTAGKSTTAAAFVRAGHRLLTDDLLAIDTSEPGHPQIAPSFPQIKLSEDAEKAVVMAGAQSLPLVMPDFGKRQQRLPEFSHDWAPVSAIYVLVRGQKAQATRLPPADALSAIIQFSYISRFDTRSMGPDEARRHLRQCAMVVNCAQIYRLEVPTGLDRLDEVVQLVETQLG